MSDLPHFDVLMKLAQENPEELERIRQEYIDQLINSADEAHQQRLRGLQFQIDAQREIHRDSPMGACMKISTMMHESFADLRSWLNHVSGVDDPLREMTTEPEKGIVSPASVLTFPSA